MPPEILKFRNLKTLRLDSNFIREIPDEMFLAMQLEILSLSNNLLYSLPSTLGTQKNL